MTATARKIQDLRFGQLHIGLPVVQAALSGYSDWPMRTVARRLGAPYTICEVMLDHFVQSLRDRSRTRRFLMLTDDDHPAGAQLMGAVPEDFPPAAVKLVDAGFDVIDINFGCPVRKALGRCRGGFHLSQPAVALEIIQRVRDVVPEHIPVTVKMRRGIDDSMESRDRFFEIFAGAMRFGVAAVTVHTRTVEQRYNGPGRPEFLSEIRSDFPDATILGSGDLFTASDCVRMLRDTTVNGVTAARGAIGNPWIFQQAARLLAGRPLPPPPTVHDQRDVLLLHFECSLRVYREQQACRQMRKLALRYADWHPQAEAVRGEFLKVQNAADWLAVVQCRYAANAPGQYPDNPGRPKPPAGSGPAQK